jgi:hypothetical protein
MANTKEIFGRRGEYAAVAEAIGAESCSFVKSSDVTTGAGDAAYFWDFAPGCGIDCFRTPDGWSVRAWRHQHYVSTGSIKAITADELGLIAQAAQINPLHADGRGCTRECACTCSRH